MRDGDDFVTEGTPDVLPAERAAARWRPQPDGEEYSMARDLGGYRITRGIVSASVPLSADSRGGSHTQVLVMDAQQLAVVLGDWIRLVGRDPETEAERIETFAREVADRFLVKVGNIDLFVMRLGGKREAVLPRSDVSEVFGPIGYSLYPSFDKAVQDSMEAGREIPYFAYGGAADQFAAFLPDVFRDFVDGRIDHLPEGGPEGLFLVYELDARRELTLFEILDEDPYFERRIADFDDLRAFQERVRKDPLDRATRDRLEDFFNRPVTVGVRDTLRWFRGSRHPSLNWQQAKPIIDDCFDKHGAENFLLPESTVYTAAPRLLPEEVERIEEENARVSRAFATRCALDLPLSTTRKLGMDVVHTVCEQVLRDHHGYPRYRVEPFSGFLSLGNVTFLARFTYYFFSQVAKFEYPRRHNVDIGAALYRRGLLDELASRLDDDEFDTFLRVLTRRLFEYMRAGGIDIDGQHGVYQQILTTFCSFQQRADWLPAGETLLHRVSLEELATPRYRYLLHEVPEIAEKLVVFFTVVLRFYLDTDFIPDLRPDEAGINIFVLGIWGSITENVLVIISEDEEHSRHVRIRFVDNKDHFKAYRRDKDREHPLGLAKHAARLAGPVIEPAMLRAVGEFVEVVAEHRRVVGEGQVKSKDTSQPPELVDMVEHMVEMSSEIVRQGLDETSEGIKVMLTDSIDDTTKLVMRLVRKTLKKPVTGKRQRRHDSSDT